MAVSAKEYFDPVCLRGIRKNVERFRINGSVPCSIVQASNQEPEPVSLEGREARGLAGLKVILNNPDLAQLRRRDTLFERHVTGDGSKRIHDLSGLERASSTIRYGYQQVDLHYVIVEVDQDRAEEIRGNLLAFLKDTFYKYAEIASPMKTLSLTDVRQRLESANLAFALGAVGEVLGFWKAQTPNRLRMPGRKGDQHVAKNGLLMELAPGFINELMDLPPFLTVVKLKSNGGEA